MKYSKYRFSTILLPVVLITTLNFLFSWNIAAQEGLNLTSIAWSPDGSRIAGADSSGLITIWDVSTDAVLMKFQSASAFVTSLTWSPDNTRLASVGPVDGIIRVWNTNDGQLVAELEGNSTYDGPAFVAWNPVSPILVSVASTTDGGYPLKFWNTENDRFNLLPTSSHVSAYDIAWKPDGSELAVADLRGVSIYDLISQEKLEQRYIAPFKFALTWSPDGLKLAAFDTDNLIQILNPDTGEVLLSIQGPKRDFEVRFATIAWSADGNRLATDGYDGRTQIWDASTGELRETLAPDRQGARWLMAWSPYGGRLALGNAAATFDQSNIENAVRDGAMQIAVPMATKEELEAVTERCVNQPELQSELIENITNDRLQIFRDQLEVLTDDQIPTGCVSDLVAMASVISDSTAP